MPGAAGQNHVGIARGGKGGQERVAGGEPHHYRDAAAKVGRILQGEDNARESVVVWPASEHDVDAFEVFISGLSGETAVVMDPVTGQPMLDPDSGSALLDPNTGAPVIDPTTGEPMKDPATQSPVLLRKTLMIRFASPGTTATPADTQVLDEGTTWIMR